MQKMQLEGIIFDLENKNLSNREEKEVLSSRIKKIADSVIHYSISMAEMPLILYLFSLKYDELRVIPKERDCELYFGKRYIADMSYLAVYIHFIEIKGEYLYIEGNVSQPFVLKERCSFGIKNNGKDIACRLFERGLDLKKGSNIYEIRTGYSAKIKLDDGVNAIEFSNYIDGHECMYGKINAMRFSPIADCIRYQYCLREGKILYIDGNVLYCKNVKKEEVLLQEAMFRKELLTNHIEQADWTISLREEYFARVKIKNKPIWIFMDRMERADDNAEALYRYVKKIDSVDSYFIIKRNTKDGKRLIPFGNIIEANSKEHLLLVLLADYIISSQANGIVENPFWNKAEYVRDLYHQAKIIFLQHGVIKDDMSLTLNRYNTNFAGFITSSPKEWSSILEYPYFYTEKEVWLTGLPRFDLLYENSKKYILVMPSWRQGLMYQEWDVSTNNMIWKLRDDFLESDYAKKYRSLLRNHKLKHVCEKYGYRLAFMPHALIEPYIDKFVEQNECVYWDNNKSYRDAFAEGNLLVTDFSSVAFDFAYLKKPIIYYQFDKEQFFKEHTYRKGYYDYEKDGFGEVVYQENILVQLIIEYIEHDCKLKDKYRERIERTFAYFDKNNCKRVCEYLLKD